MINVDIIDLIFCIGFLIGIDLTLLYAWAFKMIDKKRNRLLNKLCDKCKEIYKDNYAF